MSNINELNNKELEKVAGGEGTSEHKYQVGDWISGVYEIAFYIKEIYKNSYHLVMYTRKRQGRGSRFDPGFTKVDKGIISFEAFDNRRNYSKTTKPDWVTEDPSL